MKEKTEKKNFVQVLSFTSFIAHAVKVFPIISENVCDDFEGSLRVFCFSDTGMPIPKLYGGRGGLDPSSEKSLVERGRT